MANHQTFSGQIKHVSAQIKFGQTNQIWPDKFTIHYQWRSHSVC